MLARWGQCRDHGRDALRQVADLAGALDAYWRRQVLAALDGAGCVASPHDRPHEAPGHDRAICPSPGAPFIAMCNAERYAQRMAQLVTRVADDLVTAVDDLVAAGVVASRSEAVRLGLERLVDRYRREEIGARIANGYRAHPQSEAEVAWADESSLRMIAEEPW